jgi:hypothetical protein
MKRQDLIPRPARRMRQPKKELLRQALEEMTAEVIRLRAENEQLRRPWWRRLIARKAA